MANSVDPDQTAPIGAVCSGSTLFASILPAGDNFCHLLKTFANSLDPDQTRQNVQPGLDPICLMLCWYFLKKLRR